MNDARLTIRLPSEELEYAKAYAKGHGTTLTGLIHHYFRLLRSQEQADVPPEVSCIAGTLPAEIDARADYHRHMLGKHS